jgi:hypothetical protein
MIETTLKLLEWAILISLGIVFLLFLASGQPVPGIAWCIGIYLFWAFVNGLMLQETQKAVRDPKALRTTQVANLCFQLTVEAMLIGFALILIHDVKQHRLNQRCPNCGKGRVTCQRAGGGPEMARHVVEHFDSSGYRVGTSEYRYDTGARKDSWRTQNCNACGHSWLRNRRVFSDRSVD